MMLSLLWLVWKADLYVTVILLRAFRYLYGSSLIRLSQPYTSLPLVLWLSR